MVTLKLLKVPLLTLKTLALDDKVYGYMAGPGTTGKSLETGESETIWSGI